MNTKSTSQLIEIKSVNPSIVVDIRYATENNFTGHKIYSTAHCYVIPVVAQKLSRIQERLLEMGLGLKIYDGFRPKSAQVQFWKILPDERYISNPQKGSRHTRGTAVDVTLVDQDGKELEMPTPFDEFTERAHRNYMGCSKDALQNRDLLEKMMTAEGFEGLPTEWWHFDLVGWRSHEEIDLEF